MVIQIQEQTFRRSVRLSRRVAVVFAVLLVAVGCSAGSDTTSDGATDRIDVARVVEAFQQAGMPVGTFVEWDEDTDPNSLLGRPGSYVAKVTWNDERSRNECPDEPSWKCGGDIEIFESNDDRDARFDRLGQFASNSVIGGFYMWRADRVILRVGFDLNPSSAAQYAEVLGDLVGQVEQHLIQSSAATREEAGGLPSECIAATDTLLDRLLSLADTVTADPSVVDNNSFLGDVEGLINSFSGACFIQIDEAIADVVRRLVQEQNARVGEGRGFLADTVEAFCSVLGAQSALAECAGRSAAPTTTTPRASNITGSTLTPSQRQAVRSAESYLSFMAFSRQGLIDQLSSEFGEGFPRADATVAVDSLTIDWFEQAALSAASYLEQMAFSCQGLIEQLSSQFGEKFTQPEAAYGAQQTGICG